jgi:hypothetical protein
MTMIPKVRQWLELQGFTLEMRTASAFRAAGFHVRQSSVYVDAETEKAREVDVLAIDPDNLGVLDIRFIVECKSAKKPWVLLCSPDTLVGYNRISAFASVSKKVREVFIQRLGGFLDKFPWLRKEGLIGYSLRQALSNADVAYAAAATLAKACDDFVSRDDGQYTSVLSFAFPVIVIDGPLLRCSLEENGEVQLEEVDQGEFLFFLGDFGTCIRVVTAGRLTAFTHEAKQVADQLRAELKLEEEKVVKSWMPRQ